MPLSLLRDTFVLRLRLDSFMNGEERNSFRPRWAAKRKRSASATRPMPEFQAFTLLLSIFRRRDITSGEH